MPTTSRQRRAAIAATIVAASSTLGFFGLQSFFTWYMFSDGVPHGRSDPSEVVYPVDFGCSSLREPKFSDLVMHLGFDVPFVHAEGVLAISDSSVKRDHVPRTIYAGPYRDEIRISKLCFEASSDEPGTLTFYFIEPRNLYGFGMVKPLQLAKEGELDVRFVRYRSHVDGNFAVVTPVR